MADQHQTLVETALAENATNRNEQIVADHFGPPSTIPNGVPITTSVLPSVPSANTETAVPLNAAEEETRKLGYETPLESATTGIASIETPEATDHAKRSRALATQEPEADIVSQQTTPEDWTTNDGLTESSIQMAPDNNRCAAEFVRNEEVATSDFSDNSSSRGPPPIPEDDEAPEPETSRSNTPFIVPAWSVEFDEPDALDVDDDMLVESISLDDVDIDTAWPELVPQLQTSSEHSSNMPQPHSTAEVTADLGDNSQYLSEAELELANTAVDSYADQAFEAHGEIEYDRLPDPPVYGFDGDELDEVNRDLELEEDILEL